MAKTFEAVMDFDYPADLAAFKKAKAGKLDEVVWTGVKKGQKVEPSYEGILGSWQANGCVKPVRGGDAG